MFQRQFNRFACTKLYLISVSLNTVSDGAVLTEAIMAGDLASGKTATATHLVLNTDELVSGSADLTSTIAANAKHTLTGAGETELMASNMSLTNSGEFVLGTVSEANNFSGALTTITGSTTSVVGDVTFKGAITNAGTINANGAVTLTGDVLGGTFNIGANATTTVDGASAISSALIFYIGNSDIGFCG